MTVRAVATINYFSGLAAGVDFDVSLDPVTFIPTSTNGDLILNYNATWYDLSRLVTSDGSGLLTGTVMCTIIIPREAQTNFKKMDGLIRKSISDSLVSLVNPPIIIDPDDIYFPMVN